MLPAGGMRASQGTFSSFEYISMAIIPFLLFQVQDHLSHVKRKLEFCLCQNKGVHVDQLCSNCTAD